MLDRASCGREEAWLLRIGRAFARTPCEGEELFKLRLERGRQARGEGKEASCLRLGRAFARTPCEGEEASCLRLGVRPFRACDGREDAWRGGDAEGLQLPYSRRAHAVLRFLRCWQRRAAGRPLARHWRETPSHTAQVRIIRMTMPTIPRLNPRATALPRGSPFRRAIRKAGTPAMLRAAAHPQAMRRMTRTGLRMYCRVKPRSAAPAPAMSRRALHEKCFYSDFFVQIWFLFLLMVLGHFPGCCCGWTVLGVFWRCPSFHPSEYPTRLTSRGLAGLPVRGSSSRRCGPGMVEFPVLRVAWSGLFLVFFVQSH